MATAQESFSMHLFTFSLRVRARLACLSLASFPVLSLPAEPTGGSPTALEMMVVSGRALDLIGTAASSSEGSVGYVELNARPFLRRGELLEVIPGVVITQH